MDEVLYNGMIRVEASDEIEETKKMADEGLMETLSDEVFSPYCCVSLPVSINAVKHPGDIVEAGPLAAQRLPEAQYNIMESFPSEIIVQGGLSDLQLEGVLYACQRHQTMLANGQRAGFFIGDGAGVGKGRQIAGIILDNFCRGRCKHIWFSISSDLKMDAERDLRDIGCYVKVINGCQQLDKEKRVFGLPPDFQEGVVFSTYSTLVSSVQRASNGSGKQKRLSQLIDWCGGAEFEGCLIFDESHKAKHFIPGKEKASTKVALAVTEIQRLLPKARVVYCSATGVTDLKNMAFMERLGLWGDGTTFKDFNFFLDSVTKRGLGALEMLAMEMKASGLYVSRGLSYKQAEFTTVEAPLTPDQEKIYDLAAHVWSELKRSLSIAIERTKVVSSRIWVQFWACHQRFFKQMCISMKVPQIVSEAEKAIQEGCCVVIGLQTTGEASLGQEIIRNDGRITQFVSLTREILERFITQHFPTSIQLNPHETKEDSWCMKAKEMLLNFVHKMNLPNSPLDEIIDKLGGTNVVAEMTGRQGRVCRPNANSSPRYEPREADMTKLERLNIQERNAFMEGTKLVAIISDAASTGISLHADQRVKNQRRRIHITAELPWSADKAVQQLGRSHRSNQTSGPIYKLVTTNLGGERRFAAAVAKRLQSLGAITKGDRRAATGADLAQFNFDTQYGRQALRGMYKAICQNQLYPGVLLLDITDNPYDQEDIFQIMKDCLYKMDLLEENTVGASVKERDVATVSKFLNRILGLSVKRQNLMFSYFSKCLEVITSAAKREGRYNEGVTDVKANSITMIGRPVPVFTEARTGSIQTMHTALTVDRGVSWEQALKKFQSATSSLDGFYRSKREQWKRKLYLLAIQKEHSLHLFNITRPNTGTSSFEEEKDDLLKKYVRVSPEDAEKGWRSQYADTENRCIHGAGCQNSIICAVGCRTTQLHLLSGGIIQLLALLELTVVKYGGTLDLSREQRNLRIVRVELDDGSRIVGLRYPEPLIAHVSQALRDANASRKEEDLEFASRMEEVTPVNTASRSKALSKPVTLKKFFKASSADGGLTRTHGDRKQNSSIPPAREGQECGGPSPTVLSSLEQSSQSTGSVINEKRALKRVNGDMNLELSSKKQKKQLSIFSSYSRKKEVATKVERNTSPMCPICNFSFGKETPNQEINAHIDTCLIE